MNSLEQKDVKNSGAICDGPSHNHSSTIRQRGMTCHDQC
jgi:hypothetical protein